MLSTTGLMLSLRILSYEKRDFNFLSSKFDLIWISPPLGSNGGKDLKK